MEPAKDTAPPVAPVTPVDTNRKVPSSGPEENNARKVPSDGTTSKLLGGEADKGLKDKEMIEKAKRIRDQRGAPSNDLSSRRRRLRKATTTGGESPKTSGEAFSGEKKTAKKPELVLPIERKASTECLQPGTQPPATPTATSTPTTTTSTLSPFSPRKIFTELSMRLRRKKRPATIEEKSATVGTATQEKKSVAVTPAQPTAPPTTVATPTVVPPKTPTTPTTQTTTALTTKTVAPATVPIAPDSPQQNTANDTKAAAAPPPEATSFKEKIEKSFREISSRAKKAYKFVSRPISDGALKKFAQRVNDRKKSLLKRKQTDEAFPEADTAESESELLYKFPEEEVDPVNDDVITTTDPFADQPKVETPKAETVKEREKPENRLPSGNIIVTGNKNNKGKLLIKGCPYWTQGGSLKPSDADKKELKTRDDLVMNASVVLQVVDGRVKLLSMPDTPIVLDPFQDVQILKARDVSFFKDEILFGNTVRTMINVTETGVESCRSVRMRKKKTNVTCTQEIHDSKGKMKLTEPKKMMRYSLKEKTSSYIELKTKEAKFKRS